MCGKSQPVHSQFVHLIFHFQLQISFVFPSFLSTGAERKRVGRVCKSLTRLLQLPSGFGVHLVCPMSQMHSVSPVCEFFRDANSAHESINCR